MRSVRPRHTYVARRPARRGMALLWAACCMALILAFCSLVVDLGRLQLARTDAAAAGDAAARAAVRVLASGSTAIRAEAKAVAAYNLVDGTSLTLADSDVEIGFYDADTRAFTVETDPRNFNAVRVSVARTAAKSNPIALTCPVAGMPSVDLRSTSVAWDGSRRNCLFVTGTGTLVAQDQLVYNWLTALRFKVTVKSQAAATAADADAMQLVILSETVSSAIVLTTFRNVSASVLCYEPLLFDDMSMSGPTQGTDFGLDGTGTDLTFRIPPEYTGGLAGTMTVSTTAGVGTTGLSWAKVTGGGVNVASLPYDATKSMVFIYEKGTWMYAMAAPGRRIGWFNNGYVTTSSLNPLGRAMFETVALWAVAQTPSIQTVR